MAGMGERLLAKPPKPPLGDRLLDWWDNTTFFKPALQSMGSALMAPGDALSGELAPMAFDPQTGATGTNPEMVDRAAELAGTMTLGAGAIPRRGLELRSGMSRPPPSQQSLGSLRDLRSALQKEGQFFVRWSRGPEQDMRPGAVSKDYQTGQEHSGLSAVPINPNMSDADLVRFLREYSHSGHGAKPHVYRGRVVGKDTDQYDSIDQLEHVGGLSDDLIDLLGQKEIAERMELEDHILNMKNGIKSEPQSEHTPFRERILKEWEKKLKELGGPVEEQYRRLIGNGGGW